jgi:hypothetical protein
LDGINDGVRYNSDSEIKSVVKNCLWQIFVKLVKGSRMRRISEAKAMNISGAIFIRKQICGAGY